ncbi:hypothetical protein RSPO_m01538 (plasmid) [Ralstonia solanacearum Po82]|uniref:Uncharacterized protein n=1 Tax=Ralstonia solanacearum (strain Po82) TaxID=1031711 RepID=F6GBN2_RALS8|nr:hypothetical protein RSPO_m01538 [Ralstonia solanacearum Po82]
MGCRCTGREASIRCVQPEPGHLKVAKHPVDRPPHRMHTEPQCVSV